VVTVYEQYFAPPEQPEVVKAREAAAATERAKAKAREAAAVRLDELCERAKTCQRYGAARQQCAVAYDFNNCVKIKMSDDFSYSVLCHDSGRPRGEPADVPSEFQCGLVGRWLQRSGWLDVACRFFVLRGCR
jgi:hypothetical protein